MTRPPIPRARAAAVAPVRSTDLGAARQYLANARAARLRGDVARQARDLEGAMWARLRYARQVTA